MKLNRIILSSFLSLFALIVIMAFKTVDLIWKESETSSRLQTLSDYRYHFVMITHNSEDTFWHQVYTRASTVAESEKVALEYYGLRFLNLKELQQVLEISVLSSVDGILISIPDRPEFRALIDEAILKGIPVVSLSNSIEDSNLSYVGIATYDLGYKSGLAVKKAASKIKQVQIAVLINSYFSNASYKQYLNGLQQALRSSNNIRVKLILNSKAESFSAEEQTQRILKNYPEIQVIVCTDLKDTIGVAKVVIDLNRVSQVTIIGSGLSEEIANYIKRGVIWGVLTEDPNELGAQAMTALIRLKDGIAKNEVYHLPLFLVEPKNVNQIYSNFNLFHGLKR